MAVVRPIWGFGRAGWILLGVAFVLFTLWRGGVSVDPLLLRAAVAVFGFEDVETPYFHWYTANYLAYLGLPWRPDTGFNVVHLCALLLVMHIAGTRFTVARVAPIAIAALAGPTLEWVVHVELSSALPHGAPGEFDRLRALPLLMSGVTVFLLGAAAIWLALRSWVVALAYLAMGLTHALAICAYRVWYDLPVPVVDQILGAWMNTWVWHGALAALLFGWAVRERRRAIRAASGDDVGADAPATPDQPA